MADPAEDVLQSFIETDKWRLQGRNASPEHRIRAWFVYARADDLKSTLSGSTLLARVRQEHDALRVYLKTKLGPGPKYDAGSLVPVRSGSTTPDGTPPHLDLLDLARTRSDDPADLSDKSNPRVNSILVRAHQFTSDRVRRVLEIVWRAAVLEASVLWNAATAATAQLETAALDEILNRRLRVVERMALNVASQNSMLGLDDQVDIPRDRWSFTGNSASGWFDGLRVRLFEYPYAPHYAPITPADISADVWIDQRSFFEHNARKTGTRVLVEGGEVFLIAGNGWRFGPRESPQWTVSGADPLTVQIDFVPTTTAAAAAIDDLFDFTSTDSNGKPIRADFWNRAWLWCEQVISALCLEALLFGRRRRVTIATANADFAALAARRVDIDIALDPATPSVTTKVRTPFIALGQHIDPLVPGDSPFDNHLLMSSLVTDPNSPGFDPHFRNRRVKKEEMQVGDWVRANNAAIYQIVGRGGAWSAENAVVTDLQPSVKKGNRRAINVGDLTLQGHGTREQSYNALLDYMAKVMTRAVERLWTVIVDNKFLDPSFSLIILEPPKNRSPASQVNAANLIIIQWTPFDELDTLKFPKPVSGSTTFASGPWWFVLNIGIFHANTAEQMLAKYPKTIGGSASNAQAISKIPGIAPVGTFTAPEGRFVAGGSFWEDHVLFPMFEPAIFLERDARDAWGSYFKRKRAGQSVKTKLVPTPLDRRMVPGILRRTTGGDLLSVQPKVSRTPA